MCVSAYVCVSRSMYVRRGVKEDRNENQRHVCVCVCVCVCVRTLKAKTNVKIYKPYV